MSKVTTSSKLIKRLAMARKTKAYLIEAAELDREHIETLLKERDALKSALKEAVEALEHIVKLNIKWLINICEDPICFATAAQRAEALLRTIGKWTDGQPKDK
jgi:hypothetical protein